MAPEAGGYLARLAARATTQKSVYDDMEHAVPAVGVSVAACPGCGAGRTKQDGLTRCGYCGHEFMSQTLTDGIYLSSADNSE